MVHRYEVSNWSALLTYQLRRRDNVSAWPKTFKLVTIMGQFLLVTRRFLDISGSSICLRYHLVCRYNVSKTSVLFRYQLWHLCNVLSRSVSLRYQWIRYYDVSNRSIFFTYQRDVAKASQIGLSHSRVCCDVMMMSQHGLRRLDLHET